MDQRIGFQLNYDKVIESLVWLATQQPGIDRFHVAKILYFADKMHLERFGRPILGDRYIAMSHGPVPSVVYDMLKEDSFFDPDIAQSLAEAITPGKREIQPQREPDLSVLSRTDVDCLRESFDQYAELDFETLRRLSHDRAWEEAPRNGEMKYELIIGDDVEDRDELIAQLHEKCRSLVL